mgnify:CR=1 FL=1
MPDEKYDLVDDVMESNHDLEEKMNDLFEDNIALRKEVLAHQCGEQHTPRSPGSDDSLVACVSKLSHQDP